MTIYLEAISASLSIVGAIMNVLKNKWGFALWILANSLWIAYGIITSQYFLMTQFIVFAAISTWGFIQWGKKKGKKK